MSTINPFVVALVVEAALVGSLFGVAVIAAAIVLGLSIGLYVLDVYSR